MLYIDVDMHLQTINVIIQNTVQVVLIFKAGHLENIIVTCENILFTLSLPKPTDKGLVIMYEWGVGSDLSVQDLRGIEFKCTWLGGLNLSAQDVEKFRWEFLQNAPDTSL